jgi:hypothetical protein
MLTKLRNYPRYYHGVGYRMIRINDDGTYTKATNKVRIIYAILVIANVVIVQLAHDKRRRDAFKEGYNLGREDEARAQREVREASRQYMESRWDDSPIQHRSDAGLD